MARLEDFLLRYGLWAALALALLVRIAILIALPQPLVSDALAYFHMADGLAHGGPMTDPFGQYAFYSPGYPLLLGGPFALFGSSPAVAEIINLGCAVMLILLVHRLAARLSPAPLAPALAALAMALWIANAFMVATVGKENLSTPLLAGYVLALIDLPQARRPGLTALVAGLIFGFGLLVGGSVLLTAGGFAVALWLWRAPLATRAAAAGCFALGAAAVLLPWLVHVRATIGVAMLSTNAPFNLYLGNNPAATGWYISIADTPLGPHWHALTAQLGEAGTAVYLQHAAMVHILGHPLETVLLGIRKLWLFWLPNLPDAADFHANAKLAAARYLDVAQYLLVVGLALLAAWRAQFRPGTRAVLLAVIAGFWLIHGVTYIIPRYRDPVMPLLILMAAMLVAQGIQHVMARLAPRHG